MTSRSQPKNSTSSSTTNDDEDDRQHTAECWHGEVYDDEEKGVFDRNQKRGANSPYPPAEAPPPQNVDSSGSEYKKLLQPDASALSLKEQDSPVSYISSYSIHALQKKLEELEKSQRLRQIEIEAAQKAKMEAQRDEILEAQKLQMENLISMHKRENESQRQRIQKLEIAQEELLALLPLEASPHLGSADAQRSQLRGIDTDGVDDTSPHLEPIPMSQGRSHSNLGVDHSDASLSELEPFAISPRSQGQGRMMRGRLTSIALRNYQFFSGEGGDSENDSLQTDTFTLMMLSKVCTLSWALGLVAFIFQITLGIMIALDQIKLSDDSSIFNVPFMVDTVVRVGQFLSVILCLATQSDILTSIQNIILMGRGSRWDETIGEAGKKSAYLWVIRILIPNLLKFSQGLLVMLVSFVIIVQSENIIDLLKDFTALMVLSETDNILFDLANYGDLGQTLKEQTDKVTNASVITDHESDDFVVSTDTTCAESSLKRARGCMKGANCVRPFALICLFTPILVGWIFIVRNQLSGKYFEDRYPNCTSPNNDAFDLAKKNFGDGNCFGGPLNKLECGFEGGDCINFNLAFPLCRGDNMTNVQKSLGNRICEDIFMNFECDYDGGDCCSYDIINDPSFGDGLCNGGLHSTAECGYDNGDCNTFRFSYPDCPLYNLSQMEGASHVILGDSVCDSGLYTTEMCGYEFNDCKRGQLGQTVLITDNIGSKDGYVAFTQILSSDGTTMAVGLHGNFKDDSPGIVRVWRYGEDDGKIWRQIGNDILGDSDEDNIGSRLTLTSNGNRIAIASRSSMKVYDFIASKNEWTQVGTTLISKILGAHGTMTSDGSRLALIYSQDEIRIYDVKSSTSRGQYWFHEDYNTIIQGADLSSYIQLQFDSTDSSRLLIDIPRNVRDKSTRVFQFHGFSNPKSWTQIGQDIESSNVHLASSAISAKGNRIAVPFNSASFGAPGQVIVYDYHTLQNKWLQVGSSLKSLSSRNGDGFGSIIDMSSRGNILVIGSNSPACRFSPESDLFEFNNRFDTIECPKVGSIEVFNYDHTSMQFLKIVSDEQSSRDGANLLSSDGNMFGLHSSISGDGRMLSISGYSISDKRVIIQAYDWAEFFFLNTKCTGLFASYFEYSNYTLPSGGLLNSDLPPYATEVVDTINYVSTESNFAGSGRADFVAASFEGNLYFEEAGVYGLCLESDDGSNLYIDGSLLIDNDGRHPNRVKCANFTVSSGGTTSKVVVDYFEYGGRATLRLSWITPSNIERMIIPASVWSVGECVPSSSNRRYTPILEPTEQCTDIKVVHVGNISKSELNSWIEKNPWVSEDGWEPNDEWFTFEERNFAVFVREIPCVKVVENPCSGFCQECTGDCDTDADCEGNLRCSQRSGGLDAVENIPGCTWGSEYLDLQSGDLDFCFKPTSQPGVVNYVGECGVEDYLCGECEGDCDSDRDCDDGLECFFRTGYEGIPGCIGEGGDRDVFGRDICFRPTNKNP